MQYLKRKITADRFMYILLTLNPRTVRRVEYKMWFSSPLDYEAKAIVGVCEYEIDTEREKMFELEVEVFKINNELKGVQND